jgi:cell division initiation protein
MITPTDIQKAQFTRGVRGYKEDEVDKFLDRVTIDFDTVIQENYALKEKMDLLAAELDRYRSSEGAIFETLESAKALMGDISASAEKRAAIVVKTAEADAERIRREATESIERIKEESAQMNQRWEQFKARYRNLLQNELDRFDALAADIAFDRNAEHFGFYGDYTARNRKDMTIKKTKN